MKIVTVESTATPIGPREHQVDVVITHDGEEIASGTVRVLTDDKDVAEQYGERTFAADMRRNNLDLADIVFEWEVPEDDPGDEPELD